MVTRVVFVAQHIISFGCLETVEKYQIPHLIDEIEKDTLQKVRMFVVYDKHWNSSKLRCCLFFSNNIHYHMFNTLHNKTERKRFLCYSLINILSRTLSQVVTMLSIDVHANVHNKSTTTTDDLWLPSIWNICTSLGFKKNL